MGRSQKTSGVFFCVLMIWSSCLGAAGESKLPDFSDKQELLDLIADEKSATEITFDTAWGTRNPFDTATLKALTAPPPVPVAAMKALEDPAVVLTGIIWSGSRPSAIINDEVVGVGGKVLNMTIKEIQEGRVVLTDGQNEMFLSPQKQ